MAGCRCDWLRPAVCPSLKGRLVAFQGAHQARRGRLVVVGADKAKARSIATSYRRVCACAGGGRVPRECSRGGCIARCNWWGRGGGATTTHPPPHTPPKSRARRPPSQEEASLRAEAEAPFRSLRLVLFGASTVSAVLATLFGLPSLIGALGHAPNAKPLLEAVQDLGINVAALGACGFVTKRDWDVSSVSVAARLHAHWPGCQPAERTLCAPPPPPPLPFLPRPGSARSRG